MVVKDVYDFLISLIVITSADDPNKKELLRITMSLREANKISQSLSKHIVSNE